MARKARAKKGASKSVKPGAGKPRASRRLKLDLRAGLKQLRPPSWFREVGALLLVVFGLASLLILLDLASTAQAWLAESWRISLRQAFGSPGAAIVALTVAAAGLYLFLPSMGISLRVRWQRVLALEVAFVAFLPLAHLLTPDVTDPRRLAEAGLGGGYVGWVLSESIASVLGTLIAATLWLLVFLAALGIAAGVRVRHLRAALRVIEQGARRAAETIGPARLPAAAEPPPEPEPKPREPHVRLKSPGPPGERESIVPRGEEAQVIKARHKRQRNFDLESYTETRKIRRRGERLPPLDLLDDEDLNRPSEKEIRENAKIIQESLADFDIDVEVVGVKVGPSVTQYAVQPYIEKADDAGNLYLQRVRVSRIASLAGDLALALEAKRLRIQAPVPGTSYVGIEVPNRRPSLVRMRALLESEAFHSVNAPLAVPLGRDVSGAPVVTNLASLPHLLMGGTTGSGKSVAINAMVTALVMNNTPADLNLILLDPKMVELVRFNGLPHLLGPVETDMERIVGVLRWATQEMDRRYRVLEAEGARNLDAYNKKIDAQGEARADERLPYIVIFIDEIGDLMLSMPEETEATLCRLAQMARAVGMHVVMATQRPSTDIITGLIKANFPARLSFATASSVDSRVILDANGAETLLGTGDMLFQPPDAAGPRRVQGVFVSDEEIERVVAHWEEQYQAAIASGQAEPPGMAPWERGLTRREILAETDPMLEEAIEIVVGEGKASASLIQRRLGVGYPRAARIMDFLEELGVVGGAAGVGGMRRVLIKPGEDLFYKLVDQRARSKSKNAKA